MNAIDWDYPAPHIQRQTVDETHLDLMRHTNNVIYLAWVEQVAWDHSHRLGLHWEDYVRLGHGMVARRHELDYLAPTVAGDRLLLATWIVTADDHPCLPVRARTGRQNRIPRPHPLGLRGPGPRPPTPPAHRVRTGVSACNDRNRMKIAFWVLQTEMTHI